MATAFVALLDEPRRVAIAEVELVELPGEVLVMQMQPVVLRESPFTTSSSHTTVDTRCRRTAARASRRRPTAAPRVACRSAIFGAFSSGTASMLAPAISRANRREAARCRSARHDSRRAWRACAQLGASGKQKRAAAIVEQPLGLVPVAKRVERQPVRLEVVLLRVVHRHEQMLRRFQQRARQ